MVHVTIQGNAYHDTSHTFIAQHDRIHGNTGTTATVKFLHGPTGVYLAC